MREVPYNPQRSFMRRYGIGALRRAAESRRGFTPASIFSRRSQGRALLVDELAAVHGWLRV